MNTCDLTDELLTNEAKLRSPHRDPPADGTRPLTHSHTGELQGSRGREEHRGPHLVGAVMKI